MTIAYLFTLAIISTASEVVNLESVPVTPDFLELLNNVTRYNRFATPSQWEGHPTLVKVQIYIEGLSAFSARTMDFQIDIYLQQEWEDLRLIHNNTARMLLRDKATLDKMWHPDLYFANAKRADFQTVTNDNFLVWIYANGTVFYDARISMTVICEMDLAKFPLDSQVCTLRILSYAYDDSQLNVTWLNGDDHQKNVMRNMQIRMPDMNLQKITTGYCNGQYATGIWSCIVSSIFVKREVMHHVMQTYLPSGLIVVISWFSFWLDVDAAPARVSLSITTLLTIATQANAVKMELPEVSYMKAIDVWMGVCMTFVFGVMIEFTFCHFARNRVESEPSAASGIASMAGAMQIASHAAGMFKPNDPVPMSPTVTVEDARLPRYTDSDYEEFEMKHLHNGATPNVLHNRRNLYTSRAQSKSRDSSVTVDVDDALYGLLPHPARIYEEVEHVTTPTTPPVNRRPRSLMSRVSQSSLPAMAHQVSYNPDTGTTQSSTTNSPPTMTKESRRMSEYAYNLRRSAVRQAATNTEKLFAGVKKLQQLKGRKAATGIDEKCRWLFPLVFTIFNIIYWTYYTKIKK